MTEKDGNTFEKRISSIIEKYRLVIGSVLLLLILLGTGLLLYRDNYSRPNTDAKIAELENKINDLKKSSDSNQQAPSKSTAEPAPSSQPQDQGQVEGASTEKSTTKSASPKPKVSGMININTATASELDSLPGIGAAYAQRIVEYRMANGGFKSIDEVKNVKGIGEKTFEKFKDKITVQ